jgi:hypothetical protein
VLALRSGASFRSLTKGKKMVCHMDTTRNGVANGELLACWNDFCAADGQLMRSSRNDALPSHWLRTHDE